MNFEQLLSFLGLTIFRSDDGPISEDEAYVSAGEDAVPDPNPSVLAPPKALATEQNGLDTGYISDEDTQIE